MWLENTVPRLLQYQIHLKLYHWQTFSEPRHRASQALLEKLRDFTDNIVEFCQGRHRHRLRLTGQERIRLNNIVEDGKDKGEDMLLALLEEIETMECEDEAIENKRQEFLGEVEKTLYLFSFE
jgi:hypothetical protein